MTADASGRCPDCGPRLKPGDVVHHRERNEDWVVGSVYDNGWFIPCGWPCGRESIDAVDLVESCTQENSDRLLREMAELRGDPRGEWARRVLDDRRRLAEYRAALDRALNAVARRR